MIKTVVEVPNAVASTISFRVTEKIPPLTARHARYVYVRTHSMPVLQAATYLLNRAPSPRLFQDQREIG
jgi:hypothetical protein